MKAYSQSESTFQEWKHVSKMKAQSLNESTFQKWKHVLKMKTHFETLQTVPNQPKSQIQFH